MYTKWTSLIYSVKTIIVGCTDTSSEDELHNAMHIKFLQLTKGECTGQLVISV